MKWLLRKLYHKQLKGIVNWWWNHLHHHEIASNSTWHLHEGGRRLDSVAFPGRWLKAQGPRAVRIGLDTFHGLCPIHDLLIHKNRALSLHRGYFWHDSAPMARGGHLIQVQPISLPGRFSFSVSTNTTMCQVLGK